MGRQKSVNRPKKIVKVNVLLAFSSLDRRAWRATWKLFKVDYKTVKFMTVIYYMSTMLGNKEVGLTRLSEVFGDNLQERHIRKLHAGHMITAGLITDKPIRSNGRGIALTGLGKTIVTYYMQQMNAYMTAGEKLLNVAPEYFFDNTLYADHEIALPENQFEFLMDFFNKARPETQKLFLNEIIKTL